MLKIFVRLFLVFLFVFPTFAFSQDCTIRGMLEAGDSDTPLVRLRPFVNFDDSDGHALNDPNTIPNGTRLKELYNSLGYIRGNAAILPTNDTGLLDRTTNDVVRGRYMAFAEIVELGHASYNIGAPYGFVAEMEQSGILGGRLTEDSIRAESSGIDGSRLSNDPRGNRVLINATVDGSPTALKMCEFFGFRRVLGANYRRAYRSPDDNYQIQYSPNSDSYSFLRADSAAAGYETNTQLDHLICADPVLSVRCGGTPSDGYVKKLPEAHGSNVTSTPAEMVLRINAGGPTLDDDPDYLSYSFFNNGAGNEYGTSSNIDMSHPSVPAGTPMALFKRVLYDPSSSGDNMQFNIMTPTSRQYEVSLYFSELYSPNFAVGRRVFDLVIDGTLVLDNYDIYADAGAGRKGVVKKFTVTSDGEINIELRHVTENPAIAGIEIRSVNSN